MSRKVLAVLAVLAVLFAAGSALAASGIRDLYLVSTDGIAFVPQNGALGANLRPTNPSIQCGIRGAPGSVWAKSFDAFQAVAPIAPPGWCKYWTRGFAGTNGPTRTQTTVENGQTVVLQLGVAGETGTAGIWKPPAATYVGNAQLPAPIIDVLEGEDVFVHLANIGNKALLAPSDPHTIHLHGQQVTTQNDGFPESSWVVPVGAQAVYYFYAERPGSYMYHCHVEASEHVQMGMYGALIIRPGDFNPAAPTVFRKSGLGNTPTYNDAYSSTGTKPLEYIFLLGDVDMTWHEQVRTATNPPDAAAQFRQNYWLINGRSFPDTILPGVTTKASATTIAPVAITAPVGPPDGFLPGSLNLANYGTVYEIPQFGGAIPPKILVRYIDISYVSSPMHFHGWHFRTVGIDGNGVPVAAQKDEYTVGGASGKTYDLIITAAARDAGNLPGSQYAASSPPLAAGQTFTNDGALPPATPKPQAKEFFLLPTGFPALYNLNGLSVPGPITGLSGTAAAALGYGFADVGATQANGTALAVGPAGFPPAVTVSGPTMLPAGAAAQMQLVAKLVNSLGAGTINDWTCTPDPLVAPPIVPPATAIGRCGWATGPANNGANIYNLNPFTIPNNITDLWYPTHDHNDFKVTNNGLYPGGAIGLLWAHPGAAILPRP